MAGASLTYTDLDGFTALHHAARHGKKEVVRYLVQNMTREELNIEEKVRQQTALHKSAWYGYRTICVLLIEGGASLLVKDYQYYTPYQRSIQSEDEELMKYLGDKEKQERKKLKHANAQQLRKSKSPGASPQLSKAGSLDTPDSLDKSTSLERTAKEKSRSLGRTTA
jgi:ankyrin repeat protein